MTCHVTTGAPWGIIGRLVSKKIVTDRVTNLERVTVRYANYRVAKRRKAVPTDGFRVARAIVHGAQFGFVSTLTKRGRNVNDLYYAIDGEVWFTNFAIGFFEGVRTRFVTDLTTRTRARPTPTVLSVIWGRLTIDHTPPICKLVVANGARQ